MQVGTTPRTRGRRYPQRQQYEADAARAILAEGYVCSVGFVEAGEPRVMPTCYGLRGDTVYLHGSTGSGWLGLLGDGRAVCISVMLLDALVLADALAHHSVNYRSVTLFGHPRPVTDDVEKVAALTAVVEHVVPGRPAELPKPTAKDLAATSVLAVALAEASVKVRAQGPLEDTLLPVWTGVLPRRDDYGPAQPTERATEMLVPDYLAGYRR
ncbi:MAG: pyridoxamine 5'-phosphate oxidase family protein [Mycobacteriales bacterium]